MLYSVSRSGAPEGPYESTSPPCEQDHLVADAKTIADIFKNAVKRGGSRPMLGTREVFGEVCDGQADTNHVKKVSLCSDNV